ncbi:beta-ribofuranosylaminobenzene 5'-phosphate synthase [Ferroglobus sp.]|uniref:beta-ribofuranosylaminobenzene 5'-phosphate synthase n=1 Tax=Ferroglobus sp. TaxID=2614230 RepID=UPI0025BDAF9C|nr:beta-ribofuranosylaminobenzene 5'-phosphate synthase [Ferroglobus sp.]
MIIRTPSRIHVTLIDLNGEIGRIDGGVGFALEEPYIKIRAEKAEDVKIAGESFNRDRFEYVAKIFKERFGRGIKIEVISDYKPHVGLGSGTQISLAVGKAYSELYGLNLSTREIARITKRGGTSGIGVAAFEFGGFIVDGGHSKKVKNSFLPSAFSNAPPAPLISRLDFPDWEICLIIPEKKGFFGKKEVDLFEKNTPVKIEEVRELCHIILMKLLPAVAEKDLEEFSSAISRIQEIGFKKAEVNQYGEEFRKLMKKLQELGACGMSSTGPTLYLVSEKINIDEVKEIVNGYDVELILTKGRNRGAEVEV